VSTISISRVVAAPVSVSWGLLADLAGHPTWMKDAEGLEFIGEQTSGPGTTMRVPTRVGPFRTRDLIEVTHWAEGASIKVNHKGLVRGTGEFELTGDLTHSIITWHEKLRFPWWLGGPITAWLAKPILRRIWQGNLDRFASLAEDPPAAS
jgi:uncharacterized protein YndB with AHSA1/START domain